MKKVFVKAALPTLAESGHGWDDISALRWIPARHEKTFSKPMPLNYNQGNLDWENMRQQEKNTAKHPDDVWAERTPLPHWQDPRTTGTFVGPATQQGIPTDTLMGPAIDSTLLGLIGEQGKPNFWRTPRQGAQSDSAGEGFQYGGYDPSAYVKIPTSQKLNPFKLDKYKRLLENPTGYAGWASRPIGQFTQSFIDEADNLRHQFPDVPTRDIWGPSTLEINPLMEGFHPDDYKVAGEPMNLVWQLLKAGMAGTARSDFSRFNMPTELYTPNVTQFLEEQGGEVTLGDMMEPYLMGRFTNPIHSDSRMNPPSYQSQAVDQNQELQNAPFPLTQEDASNFASQFQTDEEGYQVPWARPRGENKTSQDMLSNIVRVLHGRLRQQDNYEMRPPRTYRREQDTLGRNYNPSQTEKLNRLGTKGRTLERLNSYMNTPITMRTGEPMDLAWRLLKAQQTLDAYHSGNIEEGFEPDVQNVIIASRPGKEKLSPQVASDKHDEMLRRISELEGAEGIRIISARGMTEETQGDQKGWGGENSFMLTNVPDDMMPHIHSLAGEFGQDSILHSPKGTAGIQFVDSSGESEGGLEEGGFTEGTPPNYTEFPTGQKYAYGDYVAVNKGEAYHPSVGGYLEDAQTMVTNSGNVIPRLGPPGYKMDPENPGEEFPISPPVQEQPVQQQPVQEQPVQQQTYDGRPMPEERIELDDSFWDDMFWNKKREKLEGDDHNSWKRITPKEKEEVKERVTTAMQGLINPDGSWNDWAMENLNHETGKGGGPSIGIRTHLFGPDGHRLSLKEDDISNGDSIVSVVNAHRKRGKTFPGFRTVMLRRSEYRGPRSQPFKADDDVKHQRDQLNVQNVIDHAPELDDNGQRVTLHGVPGKTRKEWKRRGRGDRRRKGYPVYVLNQLGDVLVKDRVSPEAKRHKLEYDTAYEANPERRKYRADLNRERRRRGMYGDHSGRDISHTEGGKLTVEGAHENRGRHFKNQGTLRHVGVKKKANDERKANLVSVVPPLKGENE